MGSSKHSIGPQIGTHSSRDSFVSLGHGHQVTQPGLGGDEPQADVGGDDPASEGVAAQRVLGRGSSGRQADVDFSVFNRKYLVELSTTTLSMLDIF